MKYKVPCWNCDEGFIETVNDWQDKICPICYGNGFLVVSELTEDNYEEAIPFTGEP